MPTIFKSVTMLFLLKDYSFISLTFSIIFKHHLKDRENNWNPAKSKNNAEWKYKQIWYQNKTYLGSMSQKDFVYLNHK